MASMIRRIVEGERALVTAEEVARVLGVSRARVYDLARTGVLPSVRLGRSIRFGVSDLDWILRAAPTPRDAHQPMAGSPEVPSNG